MDYLYIVNTNVIEDHLPWEYFIRYSHLGEYIHEIGTYAIELRERFNAFTKEINQKILHENENIADRILFHIPFLVLWESSFEFINYLQYDGGSNGRVPYFSSESPIDYTIERYTISSNPLRGIVIPNSTPAITNAIEQLSVPTLEISI